MSYERLYAAVAGDEARYAKLSRYLENVPPDGRDALIESIIKYLQPRELPCAASDCGDRYAAELKRRFGGAPCGACEAERRRMNTLTVSECIAQREQIIEGTIKRAKKHPNWWTRIEAHAGDTLAPGRTREAIGEAFDAAMSLFHESLHATQLVRRFRRVHRIFEYPDNSNTTSSS